jgi:uncharacterized protein (TIGR03118 family)
MHRIRISTFALAMGAALVASSPPAVATDFNVTNLVTDDQSANAAQITDPGLKNAWGMSYSPTSPFWVSSNGAGTSVIYKVDPLTQATTKLGLTVSIPGDGSVTGQAFNPMAGSGAFNGNLFLFVSQDGTVSGWRGALGTSAETLVTASAIYTGSSFSQVGSKGYLYAADFHSGAIDIYKGDVSQPNLSGSFLDPNLPAGYAPFNVQTLGNKVYVTYAQQDADKEDEVAGAGLGIVDEFNLEGHLTARVATGGTLNAPWGLAIAPASFGDWAGQLLVGNFGDGRINVYDIHTHSFLGQVAGGDGQPLSIDGLWAIAPGNDGNAGSSSLLYFTAGPDDEEHGLFGVLTAVPEPSSYLLLGAGLVLIGVMRSRREPG